MYEKLMIQSLTNVLYWMREIEENAKEGTFTMSPASFIINWMHDLAMTQARNKYEDLDWNKIYAESQKKANERWEEENAKING